MSDESSMDRCDESASLAGNYVVTFRTGVKQKAARDALRKTTGLQSIPSAADFTDSQKSMKAIQKAGSGLFPTLGVAVITSDEHGFQNVVGEISEGSDILGIEPERWFHALGDQSALSLSYLKGYRDAVEHLYAKARADLQSEMIEDGAPNSFAECRDDSRSTWGLKSTQALTSRYSGAGIKIAVLDTGLDLSHPDFKGRSITAKSFIVGESVQDGDGHGTHCAGVACGNVDANGCRYGVAYGASIYIGKVLNNKGLGKTSEVLAGLEWAISNKCEVISISLGNDVTTPSLAYETIGTRALRNGSLIVAAAGNHGKVGSPRNTVGQPANCQSIMAVGAVDNTLKAADFSAVSGNLFGASVDIAGYGVRVYSSWPMGLSPSRYHIRDGTSMATPLVAGIAALYAESDKGARGAELWRKLTSQALRLPLPASGVGAGLVRAPV